MATDPITRLQFARDEVDCTFGDGYAAAHPEVVVVVVQTAASDWAAANLARAMQLPSGKTRPRRLLFPVWPRIGADHHARAEGRHFVNALVRELL
jgi:hypothetical protein